MKRCVIQFNGGGGFANFAAERLEMMPDSGSLIAAYDADGKLAGVFDLTCILSIYLSEQQKP
jgi:hypothetical protein